MELWYPGAKKRPLGTQTEPKMNTPKIFIVHTMSGYLTGTDSFFRAGGYDGTESHFGVGGKYDGDKDGEVWQWQDLGHTADAQYEGNAIATSVETSDGNKGNVPWTAKQVEAIVKLGVWWCKQTGNPAKIVTSPDGKGFGWHAQFKVWNRAGHDCPGSARLQQYKADVVPEIARRLTGATTPPAPTTAPPFPGRVLMVSKPEMTGADVLAWQRQMRARSWAITVDGHYKAADAVLCTAFQKDSTAHGWPLDADGEVGTLTWKATFERPVT
jgi:hypothetical protein